MTIRSPRRNKHITFLFALCTGLALALPSAGVFAKSTAGKQVKEPPAPRVVKDWGAMTKCASCAAAADPSPKQKKECAAACKRVGLDL
ncbi:MAG TPA: hypothetical protein PK586_16735 [Casimicrobium sp.]|nr:hypothetical protein [Casimicrobium sp.]